MNNSLFHQMFCSNAHCLDGHTFDTNLCNGPSNWKRMEPRIFFGQRYGTTNNSAMPIDFTRNASLLNLINVN